MMRQHLHVVAQACAVKLLDRPGDRGVQKHLARRQQLAVRHIADLVVDEVEALADDLKDAPPDERLDLAARTLRLRSPRRSRRPPITSLMRSGSTAPTEPWVRVPSARARMVSTTMNGLPRLAPNTFSASCPTASDSIPARASARTSAVVSSCESAASGTRSTRGSALNSARIPDSVGAVGSSSSRTVATISAGAPPIRRAT
jgi:hypothetical protein